MSPKGGKRPRTNNSGQNSSDSDKDQENDDCWKKLYFEKDMELTQVNKEFRQVNKEFRTALQKNTEVEVKNKELEKDMATVNSEFLKMKGTLTARGAIELMESQKFSSLPPHCNTREKKYQHLYINNTTFYDNVKTFLGRKSAYEVGSLAKDLFSSASKDIHTAFKHGDDVTVLEDNYHPNQLKLLRAICKTLYVEIEVIPKPA